MLGVKDMVSDGPNGVFGRVFLLFFRMFISLSTGSHRALVLVKGMDDMTSCYDRSAY